MTDEHPPPNDPIDEVDELDELLSAHLDAELELLEERPDLDDDIVAARLRELRGVAEAVGASVPPLPAAIVDDQIAAALQALPTPADAPASLTSARAARRRSTRLADRLPVLGAAAAVLLFVFGLAVVVTNLDGGGDDDADSDAATEAADFRRLDDDDAEEAEDGADTAAAEVAPAETEAPADAPAGALDESTVADDAGDAADTTEAATDDTEAAAPTTTAVSGEEGESAVPIELPEVCTTDLLARLAADELVSAVERLDGTAEVIVDQGGAQVTVVIDPDLCDGDTDPILPEQP